MDDNGSILAYFSVTTKEIVLSEKKVSAKVFRNLGGRKGQDLKVRSYLIGQLGKNFNIPDNPLSLSCILQEIYPIILEAQALVGGRCLILECSKELQALYQKEGFVVAGPSDGAGCDITMLRVIKQ